MKLFLSIVYFVPLLASIASTAQPSVTLPTNRIMDVMDSGQIAKTKKLNIFVISKRHKGKLDLATRYNVFRTKVKAFFYPNHFVSIVAKSETQACDAIVSQLDKRHSNIGTIWFDSHGEYIKGYSLFTIGKDEINFKSLKNPAINAPLKRLATYANRETRVVIGACYGGATYRRSSIDYKDTTRMNGDSLMFEMGNIFDRSTIYASESWVMTSPGLFMERGSVAGYPGRNLFHDLCYRPAWENIGKWNEYKPAEKTFRSVNPVTLDKYGNLKLRIWSYDGHTDVNKAISTNLAKLGPGLYR